MTYHRRRGRTPTGHYKKEGKKIIQFICEEEDWMAVSRLAQLMDRPLSTAMRKIISEWRERITREYQEREGNVSSLNDTAPRESLSN